MGGNTKDVRIIIGATYMHKIAQCCQPAHCQVQLALAITAPAANHFERWKDEGDQDEE